MNTPALTIGELARLMNRYAAAAYDVNLRHSDETDAVLLGKLTMLDVIGDGACCSGRNTAAAELEELAGARDGLGRAWDFLKDRVDDPPVELVFEHGTAPAGSPVLRAKTIRRVSRIGSHV